MPKKLKLFRINGDLEELDIALEIFVNIPCLYPITANQVISQSHGLASISSDNPWSEVISELGEIERDCNIIIDSVEAESIDDSLAKVKEYIHHEHEKLKNLNLHKKEAENLQRIYSDAITQIRNISSLDISLDDLFSCEYINARFGKLPKDSYEMLDLYRNKPFLLQVFNEEKNFYWCMYIATDKHEREIDNIFSSLFFERVFIPDFIHGTPEEAIQTLKAENEIVKISLDEIQKEISEILLANKDQLSHIKGELRLLEKMYYARKYVVSMGKKFIITGYVHQNDEDLVRNRYSKLKSTEIDIVPANLEMRFKPPKKIKKRCS